MSATGSPPRPAVDLSTVGSTENRSPAPRKFSASALAGFVLYRVDPRRRRAAPARRHHVRLRHPPAPQTAPRRCRPGGCAPSPRDRAPSPGARPRRGSRRPAPGRGSSPDGSRRSSIVLSPRNSALRAFTSASRVTRPVSSDDARPFKCFGGSPSRSAFSVS